MVDEEPHLERALGSDFLTVDWVADEEKERHRKASFVGKGTSSLLANRIIRAYDAIQGWIVVALVGLCTGVIAGWVDMGVAWLGDVKLGFCATEFWLSQDLCCEGQFDCDSWHYWSDFSSAVASNDALSFVVNYLCYVVVGVILAIHSAWLVKVFAPYAAGSGIPELKTILSGFVMRKYLGAMTLLLKCVGLILSVASGLTLGKEGPFVHIAACTGNILSRLFPKYRSNEAKRREIISAAAAAGVAVAFGAPIGGVLFSLEEVSSYFPHKTMWRSFFCAMIAALVLGWMNPHQTGKLVLFEVSYHNTWYWFELLPFIVLGCMGGILGGLFVKLNVRVASFRHYTRLKEFPVWEVFVIALLTGICNYLSEFTRGSMTELIALLFQECDPSSLQSNLNRMCDQSLWGPVVMDLVVVAFVKYIMAIFTFGIRVPAGIFIPSMTVGACLGRAMGICIEYLQQSFPDLFVFYECSFTSHCVTPGMYALIGAASVLGGVTRMTVSLVVIMFELTGGLQYVLPIMVAVLFSKWVGDIFGKDSIYDEHIHLCGYPYLDSKLSLKNVEKRAENVMQKQPALCVIPAFGTSLANLEDMLAATTYQGFPVVNNKQDMMLIGYIGRADLASAVASAIKTNPDMPHTVRCFFSAENIPHAGYAHHEYIDLSTYIDHFPISIAEKTPVPRIFELFKALGLRYCLVVKNGHLVGIIKKKDLLDYLMRYSRKTHDDPTFVN